MKLAPRPHDPKVLLVHDFARGNERMTHLLNDSVRHLLTLLVFVEDVDGTTTLIGGSHAFHHAAVFLSRPLVMSDRVSVPNFSGHGTYLGTR